MRRGRESGLWDSGVEDERGDRIFVRYCDMTAYLTEEFFRCRDVYITTEELGCLPFAGGWAQQPEWIVRAVMLFKRETALWEQREYEERNKDR